MATVNHFRIFCEVVKSGSMSKAADQLYIAQSSVSRRISELEEEYGIQLFERLNRKLYLTAHGQKLYELAQDLVSRHDALEREMQLLPEENHTIRIGTTPSVGSYLLSTITSRCKAKHPEINLDIGIFGNQSLYRRLSANDLDLALTDQLANKSEFDFVPFISEQLILVCGEGHPFYSRKAIQLQELNDQPFVHRELTSGTRTLVDELFRANNIHVQSSWMSNNIQPLIGMLLSNNALTIISKPLVGQQLESGLLREVEIEGLALHRTFKFYFHKDKTQQKAIRSFLNSVCEGAENQE